jgi:glycolate oxidase
MEVSVRDLRNRTAEVVAAVQAANAAGVPLVSRGAGTGLCGGANAIDGCVMLSMHRMDQVLEIDAANRMARVQPGVLNGAFKRAVAEYGLFYPPDPASFEISSIGGNLNTNAGGLCCVKYGVTRDYVIGLEVVLASGEVIRTGRKTLKSTTGLDLTGLFVGSEGVLGVITEVVVKLLPAPPPVSTGIAYFGELPASGTAILDIFRAGHDPSLMEIIDQACLVQTNAVYNMGLDTDAACLLLMQSTAGGAGGAADAMADMARICEAAGASEVHFVTDPAEGDMFVEVRRRVGPALAKMAKTALSEDVAVPRQHLTTLLAGIVDVAQRRETRVPTLGHAGDGNMHPILVFDGDDAGELERARLAFADIVDLALGLGGTMAGEHGIGTLKRSFLGREVEPGYLALQHRLKDLLDPHGILNPGKAI